MTAGWCLIGYMWNRPIFKILVDTSRYTYNLIEESKEFTINIPLQRDLSQE